MMVAIAIMNTAIVSITINYNHNNNNSLVIFSLVIHCMSLCYYYDQV